jgi:hypothetical protein
MGKSVKKKRAVCRFRLPEAAGGADGGLYGVLPPPQLSGCPNPVKAA